MSEVELYWKEVAKHFEIETPFKELHPMLQMKVLQSINALLDVMHQVKHNQFKH